MNKDLDLNPADFQVCDGFGEANPSHWCFPLKLTSIKKL